MSERFFQLIEGALCRLFYAAMSNLDVKYPKRARISAEFLAHEKEVNSLFTWYTTQLALLQKARRKYAREPKAQPSRSRSNVTFSPEDLLLELITTCLGASWTVAVAAFGDMRSLLKQIEFIIEIALSNPIRCLDELRVLTQTLSPEAKDVAGGGKSVSLKTLSSEIDRKSNLLGARIIELLGETEPVSKKKTRRP